MSGERCEAMMVGHAVDGYIMDKSGVACKLTQGRLTKQRPLKRGS